MSRTRIAGDYIMTTLIHVILLLVGFPAFVSGQESSSVDPLAEFLGPDWARVEPDRYSVGDHFERETKFVNVTCDIVVMPQPLSVTRAEITLVAHRAVPMGDWELTINHACGQLDWLSETQRIWPGPIEVGDVQTLTVEFVPMESGLQYFSISAHSALLKQEELLCIDWCLDEEGELTYLASVPIHGSFHNPIKTTFFGADSVMVGRQSILPCKSRAFFSSYMRITPPLAIGDTSTIRYHLTARDYVPDGIDFRFYTTHIEIVKLPERFDRSIGPGETIVLEVDVVPASVRNAQSIELWFDPELQYGRKGRNTMIVPCTALFHDDGSLRYVFSRGRATIPEDRYPQSFPEAEDDGKWQSRIITKDGPPLDSTYLPSYNRFKGGRHE